MKLEELKNKNILIVSHTFVKGASQELEDFLVNLKVKDLVFIGHPFAYCEKTSSFIKRYKKGELVFEKTATAWKLPLLLLYLKDVFCTLWWALGSRLKFDIMFGVDNLNAFSCLILKLLNRGSRVSYYTIDHVPVRFNNKILNRTYHLLDHFCVKKADTVWNLS